MKKLICAVLAAMLAILSSCSAKKTVNNPDSGEITPDDPEYTYYDGEYIVYTDYYDDAGYAAALKLNVTDGIIAEIHYDLFDYRLNAFSEDEENAEAAMLLKAEIKTLSTRVMQQQNASGLSAAAPQASYYIPLVTQAVNNAAAGARDPFPLPILREYTVSFSDEGDDEGEAVLSTLSAAFQSEKVIRLSFRQEAKGSRFTDWPEAYAPAETEGLPSYSEVIGILNRLPEEDAVIKKESPVPGGDKVTDIYNMLCARIEEMHKPFRCNYAKLFSSL
ncbi:MAG: hypothetical protein IK026_05630 [Eubacteriaceae bacterium]|nr:hypothetical protein [Eubacteriaceae bacterium]